MAEEEKIGTIVLLSNKPDEGGHHSSGWKVALADLMTSLFASFLVLWLIASTDPAGRAEIASVFKYPSVVTKEPGRTENKDVKETTGTATSILNKPGGRNTSKNKQQYKGVNQDKKHKPLKQIYVSLVSKLNKQLGDHATITFNENEVVITIKGDTLYEPNSYQAQPKDEEIIMDIADVLVESNQKVSIEGHTDNTKKFNEFIESNYELSGLRAARIAWIFNVVGVDGKRIVPKGLGQNFPVASNNTEEGRAKNRRVIITVTNDDFFDKETKNRILEK